MSQNDELSLKQTNLIAHLLSSVDIKQACKRAKVSRKTYERWMKNPAFRDALNTAKAECLAGAVNMFIGGIEVARLTIYEIMTNPNYSESTRLRASNIWIDKTLALNERAELLPIIERLEKQWKK